MPTHETFSLPTAIEDIDAVWLSKALRQRLPEATVLNFKIQEVQHGTCTKVRLRLELQAGAGGEAVSPEVILKGGFEPHSADMREMHAAEALGYRDILPVLNLRSPRCYFADYDAKNGQGIIIMENLNLREVTFCSALKPQSFQEVALQLTELAKFHAQTWESKIFRAGGAWSWIQDTMSVIPSYFEPILTDERWHFYRRLPRAAAASLRFCDAVWLLEALRKLKHLASRRPHCVLHGDTHQGNLYVEKNGNPGFFDCIPHFGPAMWEVTYHVVCALDPLDRRQWEKGLVEHYLRELRHAGADAPDIDSAMDDYALWLARAYLIFLVNDPRFQAEIVNTTYVSRIGIAMIECNSLSALERFS